MVSREVHRNFVTNIFVGEGGSIAQKLAYLLPDPAVPCSTFRLHEMTRLINGVAYRKVDSGLKMLTKPI